VGLGRRTFAPGEVLTASNVMNYLMDQSVMNFAGTATRGSALGTAASEGMVSYLNDTSFLQVRDSNGWHSISGVQTVAGTATRDSLIPSPNQGDSVFRQDTGWLETYFGLYNVSTNPGGVSVAGWYPVAGNLPKAQARRSTTAVTIANAWADRSATTNWTTYFAHNVAAYNAGWVVPVTGVYEISVAVAAGDAVAAAVAPNTAPTSQTSTGVVLSGIGGAPIFATGTFRGISKARLTAGDVLKISIICLSSASWFTPSTTLDGNHFGITYLSPPFGA
jgi:hypothetical protein